MIGALRVKFSVLHNNSSIWDCSTRALSVDLDQTAPTRISLKVVLMATKHKGKGDNLVKYIKQGDNYCMYFQSEWKTVWLLISWLRQRPADLDLQCFRNRKNWVAAGQGLT